MTLSQAYECRYCGKTFDTAARLTGHKCSGFTCEFCDRRFVKESYLLNHLCERKRRFLQRDAKEVRLGFMAYHRFYERSMRQARLPDWNKFEEGQLYGAFVRFGRYLRDLDAVNPTGFLDFLIRIAAPVDQWRSPHYYGTYIRELTRNEKPLEAIERNFMLMEQWAIETGATWTDFLRKVAPARATLWIISGRISPWLLLTASSAPDLLNRLNSEQLTRIQQAVDDDFWRSKLSRHQADVAMIRAMLAEHGI